LLNDTDYIEAIANNNLIYSVLRRQRFYSPVLFFSGCRVYQDVIAENKNSRNNFLKFVGRSFITNEACVRKMRLTKRALDRRIFKVNSQKRRYNRGINFIGAKV
jgi:hypothetical protein